MKPQTLILSAVVGLIVTVINSHAQTGMYSHSVPNGQGGFDTVTVEKPVPPPPQPTLAMYDWATDSANPYIAINDPAKFSHLKPKAVYNHDGQAFLGYERPVPFDNNEIDLGMSNENAAEYKRNTRSGKWKEFKNGE
jgi:hypothetical protein